MKEIGDEAHTATRTLDTEWLYSRFIHISYDSDSDKTHVTASILWQQGKWYHFQEKTEFVQLNYVMVLYFNSSAK